MKVIFDHSIFLHQKFGGISRYVVNLNNQLNKKKSLTKIFSPITINYYLKQTVTNKISYLYISKIPLFSTKLLFLLNNIFTVIYFYIFRPNFIHISYYNNFYNYFNIPYVLTVYDLTHEKIKRNTQEFDKKRVLFNAKKIFCISESTKKDLIKIYKINKNKITVTHLGTEQKTVNKTIKKKTILFVGSRSSYKNLKNLLIGFSYSKFLKKNFKLIIFGEKYFSDEEILLIKRLKIEKNIIFKSGNDNDLKNCYSRSTLFVFPSKQEGFGLPLLEAMRFGCAVACSNIRVFKEVAGKSCFYFNPNNPINIKQIIEKAVKSDLKRKQKIKAGFTLIKNFTWEKCAVKTYKEYLKII
tara:strand:+ start:1325 stop:2386 length:1062 start_codon:yes stop_codon:yes gene_type:complete